ncbi:tetratricopeptide repeat protein [Streptomyces sp. NPDC089424]|uniref:tetratricopeptide repeat protein n=1 Tax=Streptomyces sp. NPDC089424 TaxID=3365917 RepID=UPI003827D637
MKTGVKTAVRTGTETGTGPPRGGGRGTGRRRTRLVVGLLLGLLVGALAVGGLLWLERPRPRPVPPPEPGPAELALAAVGAGVPPALRDLAVLIGERERHLRTHPRDARAWAVLGTAYVEQGRRTAETASYPAAEKALRTSLKVRPGNAVALEGMTALANARRDFRAARTWGEAALKADGRRWTALPPLIEAYTGVGDYKAARSTLERLQKLNSGRVVMATSAAVYWDRGWREDAVATLSDAAAGAQAPAERGAWLERAGQLAWERGEREVALRHFEEAGRVDPDRRTAKAGQARALAALGRTTEALSAYRLALAERPSPQYALELGELYESMGLEQAARPQYDLLQDQVRAAAAGGVDEDLVLGRFEADHGDPEEAVQILRAEWRKQPGIAVADALGWALHRTGENEEALEYALRATDKEHGGGVRSALYAYHRGMIENSLGLAGPARRHLEEALRINPYFSPLFAPLAREKLKALGEPPEVPVPAA